MRNTFLLLSIIAWLNSHAQVYFDNRYDFYGSADGAQSVLELDSGYLIGGGAWDSTTWRWNAKYALMLTDKAGNAVWKKSWGDDYHYYYAGAFGALIPTSDGGYAMAGSINDSLDYDEAMLYKFDRYGDTLWTKRYSDTASETLIYQCRQTRDHGYIAIGTTLQTNNENVLLMRTDSAGNKQWQRTYGGSSTDRGYTIDICDDGGFIIGGYSNSFSVGPDDYDHYIIRTDSVGNVLWSKTFGGYLFNDCIAIVKQTSDKGFVVAGCTGKYVSGSYTYTKAYITKINSAGLFEWYNNYGPVRVGTGLYAIHELKDGSFIAAGQRVDTNSFGNPVHPVGITLKVASNGDSLWYRTYEHLYGQKSQNYFRHLAPTEDGGFIAAGFVIPSYQSGDTGTQDMWVVKLDSCGCAYAGCDSLCGKTTGLREPELLDLALKVYPNPAANVVTVAYDLPEQAGSAILVIYDMTGRSIASLPLRGGRDAATLNVENWNNGIYFYRLAAGEIRLRGTIMIIKDR